MADTFQFDLVSPERRLASGPATAVRIPGADGDMTAMPDHAPTVTTLRPGILVVETESGSDEYAVIGGFAQITGDSATVLADVAIPKAEATSEYINERISDARAAGEGKEGAEADTSAKLVADLEELLAAMA